MSDGIRGSNPSGKTPHQAGPVNRSGASAVPSPAQQRPQAPRPVGAANNGSAGPRPAGTAERSPWEKNGATRDPAPVPAAPPAPAPVARPASRDGGGKPGAKAVIKERLGLTEREGRPGEARQPVPGEAGNSEAMTDTAIIPAVPAGTTGRAAPVEHLDASRPKPGQARRTRKARLRLSRLDPWSVMKTAFLFSIAAGIMLVVAVYVVWTVIGASSLFDSVNDIVKSVVSTPGDTTPFRIQEYINTQKVMGVAALLACLDVVIFTALATLGSFLYNLAATMLGGLEVTLAED